MVIFWGNFFLIGLKRCLILSSNVALIECAAETYSRFATRWKIAHPLRLEMAVRMRLTVAMGVK